jgi:hypothetical protein
MFRKSIFITLFVCLLALAYGPVAQAAYPWDEQREWNQDTVGGSTDWYDAANWNPAINVLPNSRVIISPRNTPCIITGTAGCSMVGIHDWTYDSGSNAIYLGVADTATDVNFGAVLRIAASTDAESVGHDIVGTFNQYGGTVYTPVPANQTNLCGLLIGGADSGYGSSKGIVNIYGGLATFPRISLRFGEIHLFGGTLECPNEPNFLFYLGRSENKIDLSGGTLKLRGDYSSTSTYDPNLARLASSTYRKLKSERGTLGAIVYDGTWTTLTSTQDLAKAWNPVPEMNALNVTFHYANDINQITLSWNKGNIELDVNYNVYFGTSTAALVLQGTRYQSLADPCTWTIYDPNFGNTIGANYFWRVDQIDANNVVKTGDVWKFTAQNGRIMNPQPIADQVGLKQPLALTWTKGDWAASHQVYVGTDYTQVFNATTSTAKVYRLTTTATNYSLANLAGTSWFGAMAPGAVVYWKVVEANGTNSWGPTLALKGVNKFTTSTDGAVLIDNFEDYNTTAELRAAWQTTYDTNVAECGSSEGLAIATLGIDTTSGNKFMRFSYRNGGGTNKFSEMRKVYPRTSFTGGGAFAPALAALRIDYRGFGANIKSDDDRMYVALQDTAGNVGVYVNKDANVLQEGAWKSWFVSLKDINSASSPVTKLEDINAFCLGFGTRCSTYPPGNDGNMLIDNITLYSQTCNADFAHDVMGQTADLDNNCQVDFNDLEVFAVQWLARAQTLTFVVTAPGDPVIWYKFNESDVATSVIDYGTADANDYTGTVVNVKPVTWEPTGGHDGSGNIYLVSGGQANSPNPTYLRLPGQALYHIKNAADGASTTFSFWLNADVTAAEYTQWNGLIGWTVDRDEQLETHCPSPITNGQAGCNYIKKGTVMGITVMNIYGHNVNADNFGGRWNHWVFVKEPTSMRVYMNGEIYERRDVNTAWQVGDPPDPNANVAGKIFEPNAADPYMEGSASGWTMGVRAGNAYFGWGNWAGRIDDFKMYNYALSDAEIRYLATDGTSSVFLPLVSPANIYTAGTPQEQIVNFPDLSVMCDQWRTLILWP